MSKTHYMAVIPEKPYQFWSNNLNLGGTEWHSDPVCDEPDSLCYVVEDHGDFWKGYFVTGVSVAYRFPKDTVHELTQDEIAYWNSRYVQLNDYEPVKLKVD